MSIARLMRFLHASDLHIDSPLRSLDRYEVAPVDRLRTATRRALERLVGKTISEHVDFVWERIVPQVEVR